MLSARHSQHSGGAGAEFLRDALEQLREVLRKTAAEEESGPSAGTRAGQQRIVRWLVVLSREHLAEICVCSVDLATGHGSRSAAVPLNKKQLPQKADGPETVSQRRDDSPTFFLLDMLRKVLAAAHESHEHQGGGGASPLRSVPETVLAFCFRKLGLAHPVAVRRAATLCVGLLSSAQLSAAVDLFLCGMGPGRLTSDREEREWVPYQRAAEHLDLSTHSAEQAAATLRYLAAVAAAMERVGRGVLRSEICSSLAAALSRLIEPADAQRKAEWASFCAGDGAAAKWWRAYAAAYEAALRWAAKKSAHAPFCYPLLVQMLSLAADPSSAPGGPQLAQDRKSVV